MSACAADNAYRGLKVHFDGCSFVQTLRNRAMSIINATATENAEQIAALMPEGSIFNCLIMQDGFSDVRRETFARRSR